MDARVSLAGVAWRRLRRVPPSVLIPIAVVGAMIGVWFLLALLYSGIGTGYSVDDARRVMGVRQICR